MYCKVRNVALLGHGGDGKTSLAESLLYVTKGTDRLGKVTEGNTVSDYDSEEIKRHFSISTSVIPVDYKEHVVNILDTPGYFDFVGEVEEAVKVSGAALILCSAKDGISVGTEKSYKMAVKRQIPRMFCVSKMDEEHANFDKVFSQLRDTFGTSVCPVVIPIMENDKITGVIDLTCEKAYKMDGIKSVEIPIPDFMASKVSAYKAILTENVAETSEELMEKFFEGEEITQDELIAGIRQGVCDCSIAPVLCSCAFTGLGSDNILKAIVDYVPSPYDRASEQGTDKDGNRVEVTYDPDKAPMVYIFKTVSDQYGKVSYFKVIQGVVTPDTEFVNARTGEKEKFGRIFVIKGKKTIEFKQIACGDIGAVTKLNNTITGDTLSVGGNGIKLDPIAFPRPTYEMAISAKVKGAEDKIATGLTRLIEEDYTFRFFQNPETKQMIVKGMGDIHIDILCSRLKNKFGVDVELTPAKIAYRESIKKKVKVQGRHKKQSGGHGQFGDVWIEFEPQYETEDLIFEEQIFGGSVPKNFFPAIEKGLRDSLQHGVLAGYPVVNLKATLVDGSYHDVDSSEMAFKMAASLAYKAGLPQAGPIILEPIGTLKVYVPDSYMGDVIGDLNKRRGRVIGMVPFEDVQCIEAEVPEAEMSAYTIDLRAMTQGRGYFTYDFVRYEEAPANIQKKVVEEADYKASEE